MKWFDAAGKDEKYESGRDLDSLADLCVFVRFPLRFLLTMADFSFFSVTQKSGVKSNIKPPPPPETTILDADNFDKVVLVRTRFLWMDLSELMAEICV